MRTPDEIESQQSGAIDLDKLHGLKNCDNPACERQVRNGVLFCCFGCELAASGKYEIHESGLLGHSDACNERHSQRQKRHGQ